MPALVGGRFADRIGRKKVLIWSTAIFALFTLCTVWVNSFHSLLAVRFLAGAGLGGAMPILITLASEAVAPQNRGRRGPDVLWYASGCCNLVFNRSN